MLVLDLGDRVRVAAMLAEHPFEFQDVRCLAAEAQRNKVHSDLRTDRDVGKILFRERRQVHLHAGKIDVAAGAEGPGGQDLAADPVGIFFQHLHVHDPVVHQHDISHGNIVHKPVVIHVG